MTVLNNTVLAENIAKAQDIEMIQNFKGDLDRLAEILGLFGVEVLPGGAAMYQYSVTGSLSTSTVAEGDEVPLSEYTVTKTSIGEIPIKPYRKLTTAQAILKGGYENAIAKTDAKMLSQARAGVVTDFFTFLATGTGTATGAGLQDAFAQGDAELRDTMETNGDAADVLVHFVNPFDIADYLGRANVTTQTVFGMQYLQSFMGVENIFITNKVTAGTMWVTPADNIHLYGVDFATLADAGIPYTAEGNSIIGVHHAPAYERTSAQTFVLVGVLMLAEIKDYIVKVTIGDAPNLVVEVDGTVTTAAQSS